MKNTYSTSLPLLFAILSTQFAAHAFEAGTPAPGGLPDDTFPMVISFSAASKGASDSDGGDADLCETDESVSDAACYITDADIVLDDVRKFEDLSTYTSNPQAFHSSGSERYAMARASLVTNKDYAEYFWPGHFAYLPYTTMSTLIDSSTTTILVADISNISTPRWALIHAYDGTDDWDTYEWVYVTNVDTVTSTLTVERDSEAVIDWSSVTATEIRIATAATWDADNTALTSSEDSSKFIYNFGLSSPSRSGYELERSWDAWARYVYDLSLVSLGKTGVAATILIEAPTSSNLQDASFEPAAVEFDTGYWHPCSGDSSSVDIDNDGTSDCGVIDGFQTWGRGGMVAGKSFQTLLASQGFTTKVIVDSGMPENGYRGYNSVNGIEMEHFPKMGGDAATIFPTVFSQGFTHLSQWVQQAKNPLSYPHVKEATSGS